MDPLSLIVAALAGGASAGLKDVASQVTKDAYGGLKALVVRATGHRKEVSTAIESLEAKPDSDHRRAAVQEELSAAGVGSDGEIVEQARRLMELLSHQGLATQGWAQARLDGSGAIAQQGSKVVGERGVLIEGDNSGTITTGDGNVVRRED